MSALEGPHYDLTQDGWEIVASPRHADVVTVTGPMTDAMRAAAEGTLEAVSRPRVVVAVGDCAVGHGVWSGAPYSGLGGGVEMHAEIEIPGCPPTPADIKRGLLQAAKLLDTDAEKGERSDET